MTFIWTTLTPEVRAPVSLQRAAFNARPVVDLRKFAMNNDTITNTTRHRYVNARSVEAKPGRFKERPSPWLTKLGSVKTKFSIRSPKVSVTSATYRSPRRMLRNPTIAPIAPATSPPTTAAASTGQPWLFANWVAVMAPTPAKVIWQSQSIPPSPVTIVHDKKITA